jgi:hypothetical protein
MGYYGLSEKGTAMQAASGRLVDEILDIKARDILLQSKLDSQYAELHCSISKTCPLDTIL